MFDCDENLATAFKGLTRTSLMLIVRRMEFSSEPNMCENQYLYHRVIIGTCINRNFDFMHCVCAVRLRSEGIGRPFNRHEWDRLIRPVKTKRRINENKLMQTQR